MSIMALSGAYPWPRLLLDIEVPVPCDFFSLFVDLAGPICSFWVEGILREPLLILAGLGPAFLVGSNHGRTCEPRIVR